MIYFLFFFNSFAICFLHRFILSCIHLPCIFMLLVLVSHFLPLLLISFLLLYWSRLFILAPSIKFSIRTFILLLRLRSLITICSALCSNLVTLLSLLEPVLVVEVTRCLQTHKAVLRNPMFNYVLCIIY